MRFMENPENGPGVDFDDLMATWKRLADLDRRIYALQAHMDVTRAVWKERAFNDRSLWPNGKLPTAEYLKNIVHYIGNCQMDKDYMNTLEVEMGHLKEEYTTFKGVLDVMHEKIKCWQTNSANSRRVLSIE